MKIDRFRHPALLLGFCIWLVVNLCFLATPHGSYDYIVVHHTATTGSNIAELRRAHQKRGWFEIAYHLVMTNGGSQPVGHLYATWRYRLGLWSVATKSRHHNLRGLHLVVMGNFEQSVVPGDVQRSLGHAVAALQHRYRIGDSRVLLHRDCSSTLCPGRHVTRERLAQWKTAALETPPSSASQQLRVLKSGLVTRGSYVLGWLIFNGSAVLLWRRMRPLTRARMADGMERDSASWVEIGPQG